jgi:hypothetical protein
VDLLKKAVSCGYKNASHMATDSDLDALRDRANYCADSTPRAGSIRAKAANRPTATAVTVLVRRSWLDQKAV